MTTRVPNMTVAATPPAEALPGDQWWSTVNGQLFIYFDDGNTKQWVIANRDGPIEGVIIPPVMPSDAGQLDVTLFGVNTNGVQSSPVNMQAAIDWAKAKPDSRELYLAGDVWLSGDLLNFHEVMIKGPGTVRIEAGAKWHVDPTFLSTNFSPLGANNIYVNYETGADTASGLADTVPVKTLTQAQKNFGRRSAIADGYYSIKVAQCVMPGNTANFTIAAGAMQVPIIVAGPTVSAWNNTTPPREPVLVTAITSATPPVVSAAAHGYSNGETVFIGLAKAGAAAHGSDGKMYLVAGAAAGTFQLNTLANVAVNGSGWAAYTGSGKVYDVNGSAPKAIIYSAGVDLPGMLVQGYSQYWINDIHFIACGTKVSGAGGGITIGPHSNVRTNNIHATDCGFGILVRDYAQGLVTGGRMLGNKDGCWAINSRFTFSGANVTSNALTTSMIFKDNIVACDIWENANGHIDGAIFENNSLIMWMRRNVPYVAFAFNRCINSTGSPAIGITMEAGANLTTDFTTNIWTGDYRPRIRRINGTAGYPDVNAGRRNWQSAIRYNGHSGVTPGAGEITINSIPVGADQLNNGESAYRVKMAGTGTVALGDFILRIKIGDPGATVPIPYTVLGTYTFPAAAGVRAFIWNLDMGATSSDTFVIDWTMTAGGVVTSFQGISPVYAINANQNIVITGELTNAGDNWAFRTFENQLLGW